MKKLLFALLGAFIVSAVPAFATTVNVASDGMVWIDKPQPVVSKVEVTFDEGVLDLGDVWKQAFAQKGTVVPVKIHFKNRRDGLFYVVRTSVVDVGVVYDGARVRIVRDIVDQREEISFTSYLIFWVLSVILTAVGVRHAMRGEKFTAHFICAILATSATSGSTVLVLGTFASTVFAVFIGLVILVAAETVKRKIFYVVVVAYYVLMAIGLVTFLLT